MVEGCVGILADRFKKGAPHVPFVWGCVSPKSVIRAGIVLAYQETNQVIELPIRYSLDIEKQFNMLPRERRDLLQVDFSGSDG